MRRKSGSWRATTAATSTSSERTGVRPPRTGLRPWRWPLSLASGARPDELGDGLVGERSDLGQVGQHGGDGPARDALDGAQRLREAAPERIGVEQRVDLDDADLLRQGGADAVDGAQDGCVFD